MRQQLSSQNLNEHTAGAAGNDTDTGLGRLLATLPYSGVGDPDTEAHVERVAESARRLAMLAGLGRWEADLIGQASRLHDVGKIGVPFAVLAKPGALTDDERREVERHAEIGHFLLSGTGSMVLDVAATIALTHHERYDGTGYPHGLKGTGIPLEGRITAIADVFDALTSPRVYRAALDVDVAIEMMRSERGRHFDPRLIDLFLRDLTAARASARHPADTRPLRRPSSRARTTASSREDTPSLR